MKRTIGPSLQVSKVHRDWDHRQPLLGTHPGVQTAPIRAEKLHLRRRQGTWDDLRQVLWPKYVSGITPLELVMSNTFVFSTELGYKFI